jgi:ubiquinone/menaquinone biosynthesis C-methylase UbiE
MPQQATLLARDDYVLGHSAAEHERLRQQAAVIAPATRRLLHALNLRPGSRCLDIGCGPGETMRLMGELVGPSGEVTGLDRDRNAGHEAIARLAATGTTRYRFIEANVEAIERINEPPFDLVFARLALLFTRDPVAVLRKMYAWTKPGGCIAIQDYHVRTMDLYPQFAAFRELMRVIFETCERSGQDMEFAVKLPAYFVEAGIGIPDGTDTHLPMTDYEPFMAMYLALCRSLLPKAIAFGITSEARIQRVFGDIMQAAKNGRHYAALWPLMIGVWKRKPA